MFNKYKRRNNDDNFIIVEFNNKYNVNQNNSNIRNIKSISREEYNKKISEELARIDDETINHLRKVDLECGTNKAKEYESICQNINKKKAKLRRKNRLLSLFESFIY